MRWFLSNHSTKLGAIGAFLVIAALASCSDDDSATTEATLPTSTSTTTQAAADVQDDWGLSSIDLPTTNAEIAAVYDALPTEVAGFRRVGDPNGEHLVDYGGENARGPSLWNQGSDHRIVRDEVLTPAEFLTFIVGTGEVAVIDSSLDGDVVWVSATTTVGDESGEWTEHMLVCGDAEGEFLFFFHAFTPEDLDDVVDAFVRTVSG